MNDVGFGVSEARKEEEEGKNGPMMTMHGRTPMEMTDRSRMRLSIFRLAAVRVTWSWEV